MKKLIKKSEDKKISHPLDVKFTETKKIIKKPDFFIKDKSFEQNIKETLNWYKIEMILNLKNHL